MQHWVGAEETACCGEVLVEVPGQRPGHAPSLLVGPVPPNGFLAAGPVRFLALYCPAPGWRVKAAPSGRRFAMASPALTRRPAALDSRLSGSGGGVGSFLGQVALVGRLTANLEPVSWL